MFVSKFGSTWFCHIQGTASGMPTPAKRQNTAISASGKRRSKAAKPGADGNPTA